MELPHNWKNLPVAKLDPFDVSVAPTKQQDAKDLQAVCVAYDNRRITALGKNRHEAAKPGRDVRNGFTATPSHFANMFAFRHRLGRKVARQFALQDSPILFAKQRAFDGFEAKTPTDYFGGLDCPNLIATPNSFGPRSDEFARGPLRLPDAKIGQRRSHILTKHPSLYISN